MCVMMVLVSFFQETDTCHGGSHFSSHCTVPVSVCPTDISLHLVIWPHMAQSGWPFYEIPFLPPLL
jgi:hypothetical protein